MTPHPYRHHHILVPLEDGRQVVINIDEDPRLDRYAFQIAGEILDLSPEAIHAALGQALMRLGAVRGTDEEIRDQ